MKLVRNVSSFCKTSNIERLAEMASVNVPESEKLDTAQGWIENRKG